MGELRKLERGEKQWPNSFIIAEGFISFSRHDVAKTMRDIYSAEKLICFPHGTSTRTANKRRMSSKVYEQKIAFLKLKQ